jgi:hypothetical protein
MIKNFFTILFNAIRLLIVLIAISLLGFIALIFMFFVFLLEKLTTKVSEIKPSKFI